VDAARASCRIGTARTWAVEHGVASRSDPAWRRVALAIGRAARDPDLVERSLRDLDVSSEPDLLRERIELLLDAGQPEAALALIDQGSGGAAARAVALVALGRGSEATAVWASIPIDAPDGPRALEARVEGLLTDDRAADGLALARDAVAALPADPVVVWAHVRALEAAGSSAEAEATTLGFAPWTEAERWRRVAHLRLARGDGDSGLAALRTAVRLGSAVGARDLARWLDRHGAAQDAVEAWQAVAVGDPAEVEAWVAIARLSSEQRTRALDTALDLDPCRVEALLEAARGLPDADAAPYQIRARDAAPLSPLLVASPFLLQEP
jgi:hypothetical protein